MQDIAVVGSDLGDRQLPSIGCRLHQHLSRTGAEPPHRGKVQSDTEAATGELIFKLRVPPRLFDLDGRPIDIQFLGNEEDALREAVGKIYDIRVDDANLREILDASAEKRGGLFDGLRKDYPVRREFQNTEVTVEAGSVSLVDKLEGIGFGVSGE